MKNRTKKNKIKKYNLVGGKYPYLQSLSVDLESTDFNYYLIEIQKKYIESVLGLIDKIQQLNKHYLVLSKISANQISFEKIMNKDQYIFYIFLCNLIGINFEEKQTSFFKDNDDNIKNAKTKIRLLLKYISDFADLIFNYSRIVSKEKEKQEKQIKAIYEFIKTKK